MNALMAHHMMHANWTAWTQAVLLLLAFWLGGFLARRILFRLFSRWAGKTETQIDDIVIEASRVHVLIWAVLVGLNAAGGIAPITAAQRLILAKTTFSLLVVSLTLLAGRIAADIIDEYGQKLNLPLSTLTVNLVRIAIVAMGALTLLSYFGISIAPILTALGVGSLAVALALQDTLTNLFAGFYILANKQVRPGDYIRIDSGQEGHVMDIGWRSTRLRDLSNNIILIPNAKLGSAVVTNYFLPDREMIVPFEIGVSYDSDLEHVERITVETAREVMRDVPGGVPEFVPLIRYTRFADSSITFAVILRVKEFGDRGLILHELVKRLHLRYRRENIDIPFPTNVVHLKQ